MAWLSLLDHFRFLSLAWQSLLFFFFATAPLSIPVKFWQTSSFGVPSLLIFCLLASPRLWSHFHLEWYFFVKLSFNTFCQHELCLFFFVFVISLHKYMLNLTAPLCVVRKQSHLKLHFSLFSFMWLHSCFLDHSVPSYCDQSLEIRKPIWNYCVCNTVIGFRLRKKYFEMLSNIVPMNFSRMKSSTLRIGKFFESITGGVTLQLMMK